LYGTTYEEQKWNRRNTNTNLRTQQQEKENFIVKSLIYICRKPKGVQSSTLATY
jgi:hypothetical protein